MRSEELKAQMMKAVEIEIDGLVAWEAAREELTLSEIEDKLLEARQRISQSLASQVIEQREARRNAEIPENAATHKRLHPKGKKTKSC